MCKKILSMILAAALMLSMAVIPAAAAEAKDFSDTKGHWAESVIDQWSGYGVVQGYDGKFNPNASMTRGEFATAMVNLLGLTQKTNYVPFTDLEGDEWYAEALLKLFKAGIMKGDESKRSNPNARISREEAFVMVGRALGVEPKRNTDFAGYEDGEKVSNWAKPMMAAMVEDGFIKGVTTSTLQPDANINRASVMQVLANTVTTYVTEPGTYTAPGKGFVVVKAADAKVTVTGGARGVIIGQSSQGATVNLNGAAISGDVTVDAPKVTVNVEESKVEGTVEVTSQASGATLDVAAGSTVENVVTGADEVTVKGQGEVKQVEVTGGDQVEVATPGTAVKVDEEAKNSTVTAGGETVKPGESGTTSGTPDGFEEPQPDVPSGGGSVTPPSKKSSALTIAAGEQADVPTSWEHCPELKQMTASYQTTGTRITASGTLVKADNFTGFSDVTSDQSGYYALLKITPPAGELAGIRSAAGTVLTVQGEVTKTFAGSVFDGDTYLGLLLKVANAANPTGKVFTLTADWDGDGDDFQKTSYTLDFSNVDFVENPYGAITEASNIMTVAGSGTGNVTVTVAGEIPYDAQTGQNMLPALSLAKPVGLTGGLISWTLDGTVQTTKPEQLSLPVTKLTAQSVVMKFVWVTGYEQTVTIDASGATLEAAPVPATPSTLTLASHSDTANVLGKAPADLGSASVAAGSGTNVYTASGTLKYVEGFTQFNSSAPDQQEGNYLLVDLVPPQNVLTGISADTVVLTTSIGGNTKTFKKDIFSDPGETCYFILRVADKSKDFTLTVDWDGAGTAYTPTTYTLKLNGLTLEEKASPEPQVKKSTLSGNVTASFSDIGWANAPAKEYVSLVYGAASPDGEGYTVAATGTLYPVAGFTGFNVSAKEDGYFAAYRLPVSDEAQAAIAGAASGNIIVDGSGKTFGPTSDSDHNSYTLVEGNEGGYYIEFISYLAAPEARNLSGKTLAFTFDWDGGGEDYTPTTYTLSFSGVTLSKAVGPAGHAGSRTAARVESVLNAFDEVEFPYFAENGILEIPNSADVSVKIEKGAGQYDITLSENITSGIPASAPYQSDFKAEQFDPAVAQNGYSAMALKGIIPTTGAKKVTQTNGALLLYPQSTWLSDITMEGSAPKKEKTYGAGGDYDFLLASGEDVTIVAAGDTVVTYQITNNLDFTPVDFSGNTGVALKAGVDSQSKPYTASGITAVYNDSYEHEDGSTRQVVSLTGTVPGGLEEAGTAGYIYDMFVGGKTWDFSQIGSFTFATLTDLIPAADGVTVAQKNDNLSVYDGEQNITRLNGEYFGYLKSKPYDKAGVSDGAEGRMYSVLVGESGQNIEISVTNAGHTTIYTLVSHLTIS